MKALTLRDAGAAHQRKTIAVRRVGLGARCSECGEDRPMALTPRSKPMICAACKRKKKGQKPMDDHHVAGVANHPATIPVPVNDHRADLNEAQRDWPKLTLENPKGSPFLAAAACIRGFVDTVIHLMKKLLLWIAEMLEKADVYMVAKLGEQWWVKTPIAHFDAKAMVAKFM